MKKTGIVNLSRLKKARDIIAQNKVSIILTFIFCVAFCFSVAFYGKGGVLSNIGVKLFDGFFSFRSGAEFFKILLSSFLKRMLLLSVCFVFGSCVFGVVFIPLSVVVYASYLGVLSAVLFEKFSFLGVAFSAVIILPPAVAFLVALIFFANRSFGYSYGLSLMIFTSDSFNAAAEFRNFSVSFVVFTLFTFAISVADAFLSVTFIEKFNI